MAIDPVRRRRSERLGTLNAAWEKFRFSEVQRRGYVVEGARGVYECHNSALKVPHALKTSAFRRTVVIFVRPMPFRALSTSLIL